MTQASILVPLDGSALSEAALPYAEALATATDASLTLLSVVDIEPARTIAVGGTPALEQELQQIAWDPWQTYLDQIAAALTARGRAVSTTVVAGEPSAEILRVADENDAAMIVMATRGRGGAQRWLVGSVADKVMRLASRSTLLVRPPEPGEPGRDVTLRRLLVPLDGSDLAELALPVAERLATAAGASLLLVRVEPWAALAIGPDSFVYDWSRMDQSITEAAEAYLESVRAKAPSRLPVETRLLRGSPALLLADLGLHEADLVVMSTRGRGGLSRLLLGSTADRMVRAGVPTLLIRPPAAPVSETAATASAQHEGEPS